MILIIKKGTKKDTIRTLLDKRADALTKKRIRKNIRKYLGILNITEDPVELQKNWRNEWE